MQDDRYFYSGLLNIFRKEIYIIMDVFLDSKIISDKELSSNGKCSLQGSNGLGK